MCWLLKKLIIITLFIVCSIIKVQASMVASPLFEEQPVKIAVTELPASFSPFASASLSTSRLMTDINRSSRSQYHHLFFDPLVRWGKDKTIEFRLINKLELLENNKTRFYLKKNIAFHSGNILTSKDVIWSLDEAVKNKQLHRKLQHIIEINQVDDYRFDIQTKLTAAQLLDYLTHLFILDSEYYKKYHIDHNALQVAVNPPINRLPLSGTGPYQVGAFYPGVNLSVFVNENYWQTPPALSLLNFVKVKSKESRLYALLAGDIDISEAVSNQNINSVHLLDDKRVYQVRSTNALSLIINEASNPFFADDSVRNAIHLSLNQAGMLKHILNETGSIGNTFANATFDNENRTFESTPLNETSIALNSTMNALRLKQPVYDTKLAKLLLNTLTTPKLLTLLVLSDENAHTNEVVLAIKNMLLKVGIRLLITEVETLAGWNKFQFEHDLLISNWHTSLLNTDNIYQNIFQDSPLSPYLSYRFEQQEQPLTLQQKIKLFDEYQTQDFVVPLFSQNEIWATDKKFDLTEVFSVNAIPYWHQLTIKEDANIKE